MLTIEDEKDKKFKIMIGSEISCSCGGGTNEHCVHTIFTLLKIFKISPTDPLLWQISFLDREIQSILEKRDQAITKRMNRYSVYAQGGPRQAAEKELKEQAKREKEALKSGKPIKEDSQP